MDTPGPELQRFLTYLRVERRLAVRTLALYTQRSEEHTSELQSQ